MLAVAMLEPLLLTLAVMTVPFGLYLAMDRKRIEEQVRKRQNRYQRTQEALKRLARQESYWDYHHLRFETRLAYRNIQKARLAADWTTLQPMVTPSLLQHWQKERAHREGLGLTWHLDPFEVVDVLPVNLQNHAGTERDFVTIEVEVRWREYLSGPDGFFREGSGEVHSTPLTLPLETRKDYCTFVRRGQGWVLVRLDKEFPQSLVFVENEDAT